jgi:hypothetical protein
MSANIAGDWRELFDVALFEPNHAKLRHCIANAKLAIRSRLDALMRDIPPNGQSENDQSENGQSKNDQTKNARIVSERIELNDALITLAELHQIVFARKPVVPTKRQGDRAAGPAGPR